MRAHLYRDDSAEGAHLSAALAEKKKSRNPRDIGRIGDRDGVTSADANGVLNLDEGGFARVFERFPKLKYLLLESGAGWLPSWLDRLDHELHTRSDPEIRAVNLT